VQVTDTDEGVEDAFGCLDALGAEVVLVDDLAGSDLAGGDRHFDTAGLLAQRRQCQHHAEQPGSDHDEVTRREASAETPARSRRRLPVAFTDHLGRHRVPHLVGLSHFDGLAMIREFRETVQIRQVGLLYALG
jgi:hypothetical protein